ncbi:MAG: peptidoglycan DD-metalloendopeptidase family protein [Alphaproteobacteria bacterium]|nr:peptidoglycan DD-metalloendopeptidase family protein [Alphaproteobacteria bacterium]
MAGRADDSSLHAAARASLKKLKKAKAIKVRIRAAAQASKAAAARHPAAPRDPERLRKRALALTHAASAGLTALLCGLFAASVAMPADVSAATDAQAAIADVQLVARPIDTNGDGRADFANPTNGFVRGEDAYGFGHFGASRDRGRRAHKGVDYMAAPGHTVLAPVSGTITRIGDAYRSRSGFHFVEVRDETHGMLVRVYYVAPTVNVGDAITAGDEIGTAQDLSRRYRGITNHVHVELYSPEGRRIDASAVLPNPRFEYSTLASMPRLAEEPTLAEPDAPAPTPRATAAARAARVAPVSNPAPAAPADAALDAAETPAAQPAAS